MVRRIIHMMRHIGNVLKHFFRLIAKVNANHLNAFASLGMLSCATYGLFLTNLPELIISNLNTEVAGLKNEKQELARQVAKMQEEKERLNQANMSLRHEKSQLSVQQKTLTNAVHDAKTKQATYTRNVGLTVTQAYIAKLEAQITEHQQTAQKAVELGDLYAWFDKADALDKQMKQLKVRNDPDKMKEWYNLNHHKYDSIPKSFSSLYLFISDSEKWCKDCKGHSEYFSNKLHKIEENFKLSPNNSIISGYDLLEKAFSIPQMELLIPEEAERFRRQVQDYAQTKAEVFGSSMYPKLPSGWSRDELKIEGQHVHENLEKLQIAVRGMQAQLVKNYTYQSK
jgi:hypothetical protein